MKSIDELVTPAFLAKRISVCENTIRRWIKKDGLPAIRQDHHYIICLRCLHEWLSRRPQMMSAAHLTPEQKSAFSQFYVSLCESHEGKP
mgnify:CR=1 FL=1